MGKNPKGTEEKNAYKINIGCTVRLTHGVGNNFVYKILKW